MKVRIKARGKRYTPLPCRCCDRIHFKEDLLDKQSLKEALEELHSEEEWV